MRIITGAAKGVRLKAPKGLDVRPTTDRVKESIFNILANLELPIGKNAIVNATVLDLFAGTGNLGLEALSRGAEHALFIDRSPVSLAAVKANITQAKLAGLSEVWRRDSVKALDDLHQSGRVFTLIFVDPPYNQGLINVVLQKIDMTEILKYGGIIVVEHSKHEQLNSEWHHLKLIRSQQYGETIVTFLTRNHENTTLATGGS